MKAVTCPRSFLKVILTINNHKTMNKNLFKSLAFAAVAVIAGACTKEPVASGDGETVEMTFNVDVPETTITTKGLSDAAQVDELVFQAFLRGAKDQNRHYIYTPVPELTQTVPVVAKKATVKVSLVKGQTYSFAFWAQTKGTGYYDTSDLRAVKMNTDIVKANDPKMDAFYGYNDYKSVKASYSEHVTLLRALAQVNFGAKTLDRSDALQARESSVTLSKVPDTFHPFWKTSEGEGSITYANNIVISDEKLVIADKTGNAEYDYLATAYVFANKEKSILIDASATITLSNGKTTEVAVPNAPIQVNYRTNILGDLLNFDGVWNISIDEEFKGGDWIYDPVGSELKKGAAVTLTEDYSAFKSSGVVIPMNVVSSLDLNGYTFKNEKGTALDVRGSLTINGSGKVLCEGPVGEANAAVFVQDGGKVVINDGYYYSKNGNSCIYVQGGKVTGNTITIGGEVKPLYYGGGIVEINGGVFEAEASKFVLNQNDYIENESCFIVKGGIFVGFNPAEVNECHGKVKSFVADGYKAVETTYEGKQAWKVEEIPAVTTQEGLNDEITNGTTGSQVTINLAKDATFTLNNGIANEAKKSRNVIFLGDGTQTMDVITGAINAEGWQLNYQRGSSFTFKNLKIKAGEGSYDGVVCDELVFENCTITGKLTFYGKAYFKDCVFENTMANQYSIWTWGGTDVTFDKCTFNTNGKAILLYGQATAAKPTNLVVKNCIFNDRNNGSAGKAAIEIGNDYNATYSLTITKCVVNGFAEGKNTGSKYWANKNSMDAEHLSVTIDSTKIQ